MGNNKQQPTRKQYGYYFDTTSNIPVGRWEVEGGEEAYNNALKKWKESQEINKTQNDELGSNKRDLIN